MLCTCTSTCTYSAEGAHRTEDARERDVGQECCAASEVFRSNKGAVLDDVNDIKALHTALCKRKTSDINMLREYWDEWK